MPEHKKARAAQQQQSFASGAAFGEYVPSNATSRPCLLRTHEKDHDDRDQVGLLAFVLFSSAYIFEYKAILDLESSDSWPQVYGYAP
jgi:hypothetical protein